MTKTREIEIPDNCTDCPFFVTYAGKTYIGEWCNLNHKQVDTDKESDCNTIRVKILELA